MMEWDVFISHASEDKDDFVRHLADHLRRSGLRVWFDEFTLTDMARGRGCAIMRHRRQAS
jgi:hypothetical protein